MAKRVTIHYPRRRKQQGERFAMVTAYDYPTARLVDEAGIPLILVGDSLGMTVLGHQSTIPVTLEAMLHHTGAVVRGTERALVVADLPFLTYQVTAEDALRNAGRLVQEAGAGAVKLEGGRNIAETVGRIVDTGIPVMGHLGLTPQSVHQFGGYRLQAKTTDTVRALVDDALALQDAGVFALVLEVIPASVAKLMTEILDIPTIGIGAGPDCDGQVQVLGDLLHLVPGPVPKHAKSYLDLSSAITDALRQYQSEVETSAFPSGDNAFAAPEEIDAVSLERIRDEVKRAD